MPERPTPITFDRERASSYDKRFERLAPMKEALHLLTRLVLSDLPASARVLCVGAGTGAELIYLAKAFPEWSFTAVEPAAPMLDICRKRADEEGVASRCTFHEGYLASLPASPPFDAATAILVSQFLTEPAERRSFFREIARRLRPGARFVDADLSSATSAPSYQGKLALWLQMMRYAGMAPDKLEEYRSSFGRGMAVLPREDIESMLSEGGFSSPTLFYQALFIHAWHATVE